MSFFSHVHVYSKLKQNLNGFESYLGTPKIHFEETVKQFLYVRAICPNQGISIDDPLK
jgi:hypothetical protein